MQNNIRNTNLRFNLDKEQQRRAWEYLQTMDRQDFKSYSQVISLALVDYFDRYYRTQADPYLETREREELFVKQIVDAVENSLKQALPLFLSGLTAGMAQREPQIRASFPTPENSQPDNDVAKLAEAVEKSIPIIAETLEVIRNHMIFTQYHLLHNEMQKEVIHDWMNHFNPILNKYNTVKKKLKAKVTERKELNVQKDKTSILNPIQHIKLNQQLTTITEEIEELKSRKEQLIFQAECSTDKDMTNLSKKYDQMNKNLDILDSQDTSLKKQLKKDASAFREEKFRPDPEQYTELLDTRIQIRPAFRDKLIEQLKGTFDKYYDYHRRDIAANEVDYLNVEDPDVFSHRAWELEYQRKQEMRRNQPARTKKRSYDMEL